MSVLVDRTPTSTVLVCTQCGWRTLLWGRMRHSRTAQAHERTHER